MSEFKGTKGPWISDVRGGCVAVYQDGRQEDTQGCHRDDERNIAYSNKGAGNYIMRTDWFGCMFMVISLSYKSIMSTALRMITSSQILGLLRNSRMGRTSGKAKRTHPDLKAYLGIKSRESGGLIALFLASRFI